MGKMLVQNEIKGIKVIGFDVGHTLIKYNNPLNWQGLYRSGLEHAAAVVNITLSEEMISAASNVLLKYNTRVNYREWETTSDCIFNEILDGWGLQIDLYTIKSAFYSFFKADAEPYPETIDTMKKLKQYGIKIGIVSALINRSKEIKDFGQDYTLESLSGIFSILHL